MVVRPPRKIKVGFSQAGAGCTSRQMAPVKKQISELLSLGIWGFGLGI